MKSKLINTYLFLLNISIDVVSGAICMAAFIAKTLQVEVNKITYILLGTAVWSIYTLDHLLDARKAKDTAVSSRHIFHYKHFKKLSLITALVVIGSLIAAILFLPLNTWIYATIAIVISSIHLFLTHLQSKDKLRFVLKELGVALNYTLGVFVASISIYDGYLIHILPYFILLLVTTSINLLMYSYYDYEDDINNKMPSITTILGKATTKYSINSLILLEVILALLFGYLNYSINYIAFCVSIALLYFSLINYGSKNMVKHYKLYADLVFILPVIWI